MKKFQDQFNQESILATTRKLRPFVAEDDQKCPFCSKNKNCLSEILLESWAGDLLCARIVSNKYPITNGISVKGFHEVIIDTENHMERPKDFSIIHWQQLLLAIQQRWQQLSQEPAVSFIQVFKNEGMAAGASIHHSHWQIIALEEMPFKLKRRYKQQPKEDCYLCEQTAMEKGFFVFENNEWRAWVPPMPEYNGEVWLIPKRHIQHYGQLSVREIYDLGKLFKYLLLSYENIKPGVAYNICFMSGDVKNQWQQHFYIKVVMRIGHIAGFEIATGCHVVTQAPEDYANEIKKNLKGMYK